MIGLDGYSRQTAQDGMPNVEQQTARTGADVAMASRPFYAPPAPDRTVPSCRGTSALRASEAGSIRVTAQAQLTL